MISLKLSAQACNNDALTRLKDYCNTEITVLYIESYLVKKKSEKDSYNSIKSELDKNSIFDPISYDELSRSLTQKFDSTQSRLTSKINNIDVSNIDQSDSFAAATDFIDRIDQAVNSEIKNQFKEQYSALMEELRIVAVISFQECRTLNQVNESKTDALPQRDVKEASVFSSSFIFNVVLACVTTALLISFFFLSKKINRLRGKVAAIGNDTETLKFGNQNVARQPLPNVDIDRLKSEIQDLKLSIQEMQRQKERTVEYQSPTPPAVTKSSTEANRFYMQFPIGDYFLADSKLTDPDYAFYTFNLEPGGREARFHIHASGEKVKSLISMADSYIKTACEEQNVPSRESSLIRTISQGLAELQGDRWVVKTKAVIRYE